MSTKKKTTPVQPENKPKYRIGNKLYFIDHNKRIPTIKCGEVDKIITETRGIRQLATKQVIGTHVDHFYSIVIGEDFVELSEYSVYSTLAAASLELAARLMAK